MTDHRLDRTMDDFGAELARAARQPRRRAPRRLRVGLAAGSASAAIALVLLAWPGSDDGSGLDVVARAQAALAPSGEIVHLVMTTSSQSPGSDTFPIKTEQWSASDPTRWRVVQNLRATVVAPELRDTKPRRPHPTLTRMEQSFAGGELRSFNAKANALTVEHDVPGIGKDAPIGPFGGDPVSRLREMLVGGQLRDAGTARSHGRTVRRLVGSSHGVNGEGLLRTVTFDVDPESFAPIAGTSTVDRGADRKIVVRFRVNHYERLALNERTEQLLRIATDADTKIVVSG